MRAMSTNYRNSKLLALARSAPRCFCCGVPNDGTVVGAHANMQSMGKGARHKSADIPAFLCHACHDAVDGRNNVYLSREQRNAEWAMASVHSMRWALETHPEVFA
jgi:hypothetical protein